MNFAEKSVNLAGFGIKYKVIQRGEGCMSSAVKFRNFLSREKIQMEEKQNQDGSTFFRAEQKLKDGWKVIIGCAFNERGDIADLFCFNVAEIKNPEKKTAIYELINQFNTDYRYSKFYEEDGIVSIRYSYLVEGELNADVAFRKLIMLLETAEESYPKFMEVIWS